jgi:acetyl esterase
LAQSVDIKGVPVGKTDGELPGPSGALPYRIYRPQQPAARPLPALVFFHGGGCVFGDIDTHDGLCRMLCAESGCAVISVGYRQAPEHKFPAAVEDSYGATRWVVDHAAELGLDARRIAVGGDSAGGGLAAVVCQLAATRHGPALALQVLFCPVMDMRADTPSRVAFAQGYFLNQATIDWMLRHYCAADADLDDPRLSPLRASQFAGLPPAHIHTAEFDPLRDEGEAYAKLLRQAGVAARYTCHAGMIHYFYAMAGAIPSARAAVKGAAAAMREALIAGGWVGGAWPAPRDGEM